MLYVLVNAGLSFILPDHKHHHEHTETPTNTIQTTDAGGFLPNLIPEVEPHAFIGISLCLGFVFMLLVDRCCGGHSHASGNKNSALCSSLCLMKFPRTKYN
jgi:hypothetical protein